MDQNQSSQNSEEPEVKTYFSDPPIYKQRWMQIALFIAFSPLLVLAFLWIKDQSLFQPKQSTPPVATSSAVIKEENLPIALDILQNPLVYEWRGSVEGTLVAKDEKSITLEKDRKRIILPINPGPAGVKFYTKGLFIAEPTKEDRFLSIDKIAIGTKLRGEFWVFPSKKDQLFTGSFTVIEQ